MVSPENQELSVTNQCRLLKVSRSNLYYKPKGESPQNIFYMAEIDRIFTDYPFYGSRQMARHIKKHLGHNVSRKRVRRLMHLMGLNSIYQQPKTTIASKEHKKFPYLLGEVDIDHSNQ